MFKPFFVCNFCIILNNFSRNPLETFHGDSESVRVDDLLRLILKLRIAVKRCNYNKEGGGVNDCLNNVKKTALLVRGGFLKWPG